MAAIPKGSANLSNAAKLKTGSLIGDEKLKILYVAMLRCRALEARARLLSEQGRFPFPSARTRGQVAAEVACTIDLRAGDSIASADRDFIFNFIQGMPLKAAMAQLGARSPGREKTDASSTLARKTGEPLLNACGPFGTGARLALANKFKENGNVVVAFSRGDSTVIRSWDEPLALAGAQLLPILFVAQCTPRGESDRSKKQAKAEDLSSHARRHGLPGIPVDGNDVVALYRAAYESLMRARRGSGPTLIECKTYSCDDPAQPGRRRNGRLKESIAGEGHDPIRYMEEYLSRKELFSQAWKDQVASEFERELDVAFEAAGSTASH
jgi:TPP-dependent pyruvate/acetoin dehydrogenase alpha subunit